MCNPGHNKNARGTFVTETNLRLFWLWCTLFCEWIAKSIRSLKFWAIGLAQNLKRSNRLRNPFKGQTQNSVHQSQNRRRFVLVTNVPGAFLFRTVRVCAGVYSSGGGTDDVRIDAVWRWLRISLSAVQAWAGLLSHSPHPVVSQITGRAPRILRSCQRELPQPTTTWNAQVTVTFQVPTWLHKKLTESFCQCQGLK